jgi:hypothetical protein
MKLSGMIIFFYKSIIMYEYIEIRKKYSIKRGDDIIYS